LAAFELQSEWDVRKAAQNLAKHGVSFEEAATVLLDPLAVTILHEKHSETEERWATIGRSFERRLLVAIHTWTDLGPNAAVARIISARQASPREMKDYEEDYE
jgi:uncharacterized protein